jgi:hypothetical protein
MRYAVDEDGVFEVQRKSVSKKWTRFKTLVALFEIEIDRVTPNHKYLYFVLWKLEIQIMLTDKFVSLSL